MWCGIDPCGNPPQRHLLVYFYFWVISLACFFSNFKSSLFNWKITSRQGKRRDAEKERKSGGFGHVEIRCASSVDSAAKPSVLSITTLLRSLSLDCVILVHILSRVLEPLRSTHNSREFPRLLETKGFFFKEMIRYCAWIKLV